MTTAGAGCWAVAAPREREQAPAAATNSVALPRARAQPGIAASHRGPTRCRRARSRVRRRPRRPDLCYGRGTPALDHRIDHVAVWRCAGRDAGVAAGLAGRPLRRRHLAEFHPCRQWHAGAEREHLAGAEQRNEGQHARAGVRDRRADQRLIAVVRQPHDEHGAALGDDVGIDPGRKASYRSCWQNRRTQPPRWSPSYDMNLQFSVKAEVRFGDKPNIHHEIRRAGHAARFSQRSC